MWNLNEVNYLSVFSGWDGYDYWWKNPVSRSSTTMYTDPEGATCRPSSSMISSWGNKATIFGLVLALELYLQMAIFSLDFILSSKAAKATVPPLTTWEIDENRAKFQMCQDTEKWGKIHWRAHLGRWRRSCEYCGKSSKQRQAWSPSAWFRLLRRPKNRSLLYTLTGNILSPWSVWCLPCQRWPLRLRTEIRSWSANLIIEYPCLRRPSGLQTLRLGYSSNPARCRCSFLYRAGGSTWEGQGSSTTMFMLKSLEFPNKNGKCDVI